MSKSFLETIVEHKQREIEAARKKVSLTALMQKIDGDISRRSLKKALSQTNRVNIIAEIKRMSPSKGLLCECLDAAGTARCYEAAGAAAISVLTDKPFFMGSPKDLEQAKAAVSIPILRKDFIISEYQLVASAAMGADAVLLIVRILTREKLQRYLNLCGELNLEALVEVHSREDLARVMNTDATLIGINNRDLSTFDTQLSRALDIGQMLGPHQIPIVASGIKSRKDIAKNCRVGLHNFLVGESLVRADSPGERLRSYLEVEVE